MEGLHDLPWLAVFITFNNEPFSNFNKLNSESFQTVEGRQVDEAVASIFHTVLFHRSLGKFRYKQEGSYSVGTVGYEDVDCDFIDFTYVCSQSSIWFPSMNYFRVSAFCNLHFICDPGLLLIRKSRPNIEKRNIWFLGSTTLQWWPRFWANFIGILPEEKKSLAFPTRMYSLGGMECSSWAY